MNAVVTIEIENQWHRIEVPARGTEHFAALETARQVILELRPEQPGMRAITSILARFGRKYPELLAQGLVEPKITHLPDETRRRPVIRTEIVRGC